MTHRSRLASLSVLAALVLITAVAAQKAPPPGPRLTVPAGFDVERVAGPPLVDRPIVADFDESGRLYVADSSGSNDKVEQQLADRPHRIVRLEDTDGDGRFDRSRVFADRMMLPQGTLWFDGSLYVAAPPSIWKLTDTDDDGVADQREEWFAGKTLTGCANDLHGPYLGPDGWIYWTKGAFAEQRYERAGGDPLVTRAAHVFRRRPGTEVVEPVITGGMDNPVDVAFTAAGDAMLTATFLEHPQGGRRDALIHAVYGGLYGKAHGVIDGHPQTGDLMPPVCHLGPAAPSGLTRYTSSAFGAPYRDNFFTALFNMQKVARHVLAPDGATFKSRDSDFLVSDSLDFHPTDVVEDADGSLLVVDTGAWYKLCCPTSQLAKPDVLGAIYRVKRKGVRGPVDARGLKLDWRGAAPDVLVTRLEDARPAVRARAVHELSLRGPQAVPALRSALGAPSVERRRTAVWALTRIDDPSAREAVRLALGDRNESVRRAALHSTGLWRDPDAVDALVAQLGGAAPALQRAAAEALGRIGAPVAVPALLQLAARPLDRIGDHSVIYALIEIADTKSTAEGLRSPSPRVQSAALLALDQMRGGGLEASAVVPLLDAGDERLRATAWRIAARHKDWGAALVSYFDRQLTAAIKDQASADALVTRLSSFASDPSVQALLARHASADVEAPRAVALRAMAVSRQKPMPSAWIDALAVVARSAPPLPRVSRSPRRSPFPERSTAIRRCAPRSCRSRAIHAEATMCGSMRCRRRRRKARFSMRTSSTSSCVRSRPPVLCPCAWRPRRSLPARNCRSRSCGGSWMSFARAARSNSGGSCPRSIAAPPRTWGWRSSVRSSSRRDGRASGRTCCGLASSVTLHRSARAAKRCSHRSRPTRHGKPTASISSSPA
jgi:putative membrane-bound dehydrogenase-like protein